MPFALPGQTIIGRPGRRIVVGGGTPAPVASLLALADRIVFAGNSWEAQSGNLDIATLSWAHAGCRGVPSIGMNQSRGGDRLSHLIDRIAPVTAVRAKAHILMNPINDFSDAAVTNNQAGGDVALGRLDAVTAAIRAVDPAARIIAQDMPNATGGLSKPAARAAYNAGLSERASSTLITYSVNDPANPGGAVDLTSAADSSDGVHPNRAASVIKTARALAPKLASLFTADDLFSGGLTLPNAINRTPFSSATAWTVTANSSGLTTTQVDGFLRSRPAVPARVFTVAGTAALAETTSGATPDYRVRLPILLPVGYNTDSRFLSVIFLLEITSVTGGAPIGLATIQLNNGVGQTFNKQYAGEGYLWDAGWTGPMGMIPPPNGILSGQTGTINFDLTFRGKQGVPLDLEFRIAAVNLIDTEAQAYGPVTALSRIFTAGRPLMSPIPTTNPSATVATGGTIAKGAAGFFVGGGITHQFDALRAGTTDVGDMIAPTSAAPAGTPYTTVPADTGQGIRMRDTASNAFGGGSSDVLESNLVAVT